MNRSHVQFHNAVKVVPDELEFGIRYTVRQRRNLAVQCRSDLPFIDLGDIFPLERQAANKCFPGSRILGNTIQRLQHILGIMQGIVVIRENFFRRHRKMTNVADGLNSQQDNQCKQETDTQCQSITQFHKL